MMSRCRFPACIFAWPNANELHAQMKSEEGDIVDRRRIAACCWGEGRPATCLVMLDEQGSLVDILYLPSFSGPQRIIRAGLDYSIAEDPKKVETDTMPCLGP